MGYIVSNFESFADIYVRCLVLAYILSMAIIFALWMKPFVRERKAAYLAASTYFTLQKMGEAATSETGEGTPLEDATINVVVDGVTPSTGVAGTIGVSVDEKA